MREVVYGGLIVEGAYGEDDDALFIGDEPYEPFASRFLDDLELYGRYVSVSYFITDEPRTREELNDNLIRAPPAAWWPGPPGCPMGDLLVHPLVAAGAAALRGAAEATVAGTYRRGEALLVFPADGEAPLEVGGTPDRLAGLLVPVVLRAVADQIEARYPTSVWPEDSQHPEARVAAGVRLACRQMRHEADRIEQGDG